MLWWHKQTADAHVQDRIGHLDLFAVKYYVFGCVTHARDVLSKAQTRTPGSKFEGIAQMIDKFWLHYPSSLQAPLRDLLITEAATFLPGEGSESAWEDAMIWAAAYAFAVVKRDQFSTDAAQEAHEALHQAYWSVFSYNHDKIEAYSSDDDIQKVEKSSPPCKAEIDFQLSFLKTMETMRGQPPVYSTLLQLMDNGN